MKRQNPQPGNGKCSINNSKPEKTYAAIAQAYEVSPECVRYWCRRQRDGGGCQNRYYREPTGLLRHFDPLVRYGILRLKLAHPRWGPKWLRHHLCKRPGLRYLKIPSETAIGRYLHQWPRFRRRKKGPTGRPRPNQPTVVHQQWQIDFKTDIKLHDGTRVNLHTVRDPVGEACLSAVVFPGSKGQAAGGTGQLGASPSRFAPLLCPVAHLTR